jgi:hypothetical protein
MVLIIFPSFRRNPESIFGFAGWIPVFAGMTLDVPEATSSHVNVNATRFAAGAHSKFRVAMLILCNPTLERWRIYGSQ